MKEDKIIQLIHEIEKEGLKFNPHFSNNPADIVCTTAAAASYFNEYHVNSSYFIGNVLANTENLLHINYDLAFHAVESHSGLYIQNGKNSALYKELHELIMNFYYINDYSIQQFKKDLEKLKVPADLKERLLYTINDYRKDIIIELKEVIADLKEYSRTTVAA